MNDISNAATPSLSDLAAELEAARLARHNAEVEFAAAKERLKSMADGERAAYRAFNDAVDAMKPKRKPSVKKDGAEPKAVRTKTKK